MTLDPAKGRIHVNEFSDLVDFWVIKIKKTIILCTLLYIEIT